MDIRYHIRKATIAELYAHTDKCACPACASGGISADGEFDNRFVKIHPQLEDDFLRRLHSGKWKRNALDPIMWGEYYGRLRQFSEAGYGKKLTDPATWKEFELMEQLKRSASTFAGAKLNTITEELKTLRGMPLNTFTKEGKKLLKKHHGDYLDAELQTALASANSAAKWQDIKRRAYLYPNLKYETAGDERVRQSHRELDGRIESVNSTFWNVYMPPNGWRCRCIVIQTDEAANGDSPLEFYPPKGFRNNPGATGKLFEHDHPYFNLARPDLTDIETTSEKLRGSREASEVYKLAEKYVGTTHRMQGATKPARVNMDFIVNTLAAVTVETAIKNDLLTYIAALATEAKLISIDGDIYTYIVTAAGFEFTILVEQNIFKIIQ